MDFFLGLCYKEIGNTLTDGTSSPHPKTPKPQNPKTPKPQNPKTPKPLQSFSD